MINYPFFNPLFFKTLPSEMVLRKHGYGTLYNGIREYGGLPKIRRILAGLSTEEELTSALDEYIEDET